ncbi:hypothetical protein HAX54_015366 [Datura stramonium]|uniref:Uncharacterized protein n=1 Tax=Datura stramonium TaxID=4076 RepID=A0ABS8RZL1_DATST|nr:hypothetical protein [Datura stramonium]
MDKYDFEDDDEVNFRDIQKNLKTYSQKELRVLANVLIDAYHGIINEKYMLAADLEQSEEVRSVLAGEITKLKEELSESSEEKLTLNDKLNKCMASHGGCAASKSTGQEPNTLLGFSKKEHQ